MAHRPPSQDEEVVDLTIDDDEQIAPAPRPRPRPLPTPQPVTPPRPRPQPSDFPPLDPSPSIPQKKRDQPGVLVSPGKVARLGGLDRPGGRGAAAGAAADDDDEGNGSETASDTSDSEGEGEAKPVPIVVDVDSDSASADSPGVPPPPYGWAPQPREGPQPLLPQPQPGVPHPLPRGVPHTPPRHPDDWDNILPTPSVRPPPSFDAALPVSRRSLEPAFDFSLSSPPPKAHSQAPPSVAEIRGGSPHSSPASGGPVVEHLQDVDTDTTGEAPTAEAVNETGADVASDADEVEDEGVEATAPVEPQISKPTGRSCSTWNVLSTLLLLVLIIVFLVAGGLNVLEAQAPSGAAMVRSFGRHALTSFHQHVPYAANIVKLLTTGAWN